MLWLPVSVFSRGNYNGCELSYVESEGTYMGKAPYLSRLNGVFGRGFSDLLHSTKKIGY